MCDVLVGCFRAVEGSCFLGWRGEDGEIVRFRVRTDVTDKYALAQALCVNRSGRIKFMMRKS